MDDSRVQGATRLTVIVGLIVTVICVAMEGGAGLLSGIIFTFGFYQFTMAMALGGLAVGLPTLLLIFGEVFVLFFLYGMIIDEDTALRAIAIWKAPIALGAAPVDNLWNGVVNDDPDQKMRGVWQLLGMSGILGGIYFLMIFLGRAVDD